jgi:ligand-binding sensor domain-containing protein/signal transduction histidine kinase
MMQSPATRWIKYWAGLSFLLVFTVSCAPFSPSKVWDAQSHALSPQPTTQPDSETPPAHDSATTNVPEILPALPQRNSPARFERVMDEFANVLTGPSQVIQDQYGMIWIGTVDGLVRYDGFHYQYYKHDLDDPESISSNRVTAVLEDKNGFLWVGTEGDGLDQFNRAQDSFIHFRHTEEQAGSLGGGRVNVIYEDSRGELWVGTSSGGLNRFENRNGTFVQYENDSENPNSIASNTVYAIYEDSHGNMWVGTNNGLDSLNRQTKVFTHYQHNPDNPLSLSHDAVYSIQEDPWGLLWLGTYGGGLNRLDVETGVFTNYRNDPRDPTSLSNDIVTSLVVDRSGMLWIGTMGGGVNWMDPRTNDFIRYQYDSGNPHSPSSSYIFYLFVDRSAILWVSSSRMLDKYDPFKVKFTHQFYRDHVTAIYEDQKNFLWVGAFDGLYKYDTANDQITHYQYNFGDTNSIGEWRVTDIVEDRPGILWVGTNGGGLKRFDSHNQSFTVYRHDPWDAESLPSNNITSLYIDHARNLWVGTDNGLSSFNRQAGRFINLPLSVSMAELGSERVIRALLEDQQGKLWIGTEGGGLKRFEPDTGLMTTFRHNKNNPDSLHNNVIYTLFEDSNGILWIGTEGGLHRFDQDSEKFRYFSIEHGLPDDEVYAILEDQNGNLWISTNNGLSKFNPETGVFRNYNAEDGLLDNQFSSAALRRRNGEMLFGGVNGISSFSPDQISDNPNIPPVVLLELRQDGQAIRADQAVESLSDLTLSGSAHNLEFEFAALSYSQPERNQHAYMLEGYEDTWNFLGTERVGRYTDLPGGSYTLHLKGANDDGVWNETGLAVHLTIVPPFWKARWFWGLIIGITVIGVVAGYRIRVVSVQARNRELEEQIAERTKESELRRRELETLYQADEIMYHHLNLDPLLRALVDVAVDILHADKSAVYTWSAANPPSRDGNQQLVMRVGRGIPPQNWIYRYGLAEWLVNLKETVVVTQDLPENASNPAQQNLVQLMLDQGIYSCMLLPMYIGDEYFGVFDVCYTTPKTLDERDLRLFQALVQRACLAIDNARLYENAQELAVIKERNRLARDLHDSVKQKTFAALAQIGASRRLVASQPERAEGYMAEAENLVHDVLQELVTLIQEMYPLNLQEQGLEQSLRTYASRWSRQTNIRVEFCVSGDERIPATSSGAFYRIFQEALANVARHSQADCVKVDLCFNGEFEDCNDDAFARSSCPGSAYMKITDNGCGFDPAKVLPGMGMQSMQERVDNLAGKLHIRSCRGEGTCVEVILPGEPKVIVEEPA